MNGTIRHARFTIGALGVAALCTYGCSRDSRPAREPMPTFESSVAEPAPPEGEPAQPPAMQGAEPGQEPQPGMPMGQPGQMGQPGMGQQMGQPGMGPHGMGQQPGAPGDPARQPVDEAAMCQELVEIARMAAQEVQGGTAIVLTPKAGHHIGNVRDVAHRMHAAMTREPGAPQSATECALFDIGGAMATVSVVESPSEVRILFTTTDAAMVKSLRSQARDFVKTQKANGAAQPGQPQNGGSGAPPRP